MINNLFIIFNSFIFFIFSFFIQENTIKITSNIPSEIKVGQELLIEMHVYKGNTSGFANLQIQLPKGFQIKQKDNHGGLYSYQDGKAIWEWAEVNNKEDFKVKFLLMASDSSVGSRIISAKYCYLDSNIKKNVDMAPVIISVLAKDKIESVTKTDTLSKAFEKNSHSNSEPTEDIAVIRSVKQGLTADEKIITLKIKKGLTKGFARYSNDIGIGYTAKAILTDGSVFSCNEGKLRFIWVTVPNKEELEISFSILEKTNNGMILNGEYSYLENNQSKNYLLNPEVLFNITANHFKIESPEKNKTDSMAINTKKETIDLSKVDRKAPENTNNVVSEIKTKVEIEKIKVDVLAVVQKKVDTTAAIAVKKNVQVIDKKDVNTDFFVQIGAFKSKNVEASILKEKYKLSETINSEIHNGFFKFMVGKHSVYKEAKIHRDVVQKTNGVIGAFVVAYNSGKRITVQEALMNTNQQWYK